MASVKFPTREMIVGHDSGNDVEYSSSNTEEKVNCLIDAVSSNEAHKSTNYDNGESNICSCNQEMIHLACFFSSVIMDYQNSNSKDQFRQLNDGQSANGHFELIFFWIKNLKLT
uniref:Uncharacterized protein n=1 Tax=Clastoptera arizonana TaxID=38151 RepID=A0A1B6DMI7_9HEMI